ncbi:MAG TPA: hypothetical protein VFY44_08325 [Thermoleophilaceae bacterium]|nr:hypothetical protein [Thermoleophilaceae bacterium]
MASAPSAWPAIPEEDLPELMALIEDADSVELKLTVPEPDQRPTFESLHIDPLEAQVRLVHFYDTPDLQLDRAGVVVRARRVQRKGDDSVVKLRPVEPDHLPRKVRRSENFGVEVDAMPGGFVCSGTMKRALPAGAVQEVAAGERALRKLFTKEQRRFYVDHAPAGIGLDDLVLLGPIFVLKLKFSPQRLRRRMVAELWLYPDSSRVLELSTKCAPGEAFQVAAQTRALLADAGVSLTGKQQTKTSKALRYFAGALG